MFQELSKNEFDRLSCKGAKVVVFREIPGDRLTPTGAFRAIRDEAKGAALLESSLTGHLGRYSFLHLNPFYEMRATGRAVTVHEKGEETALQADPLAVLRERKAATLPLSLHPLSRYTGGLVGYMAYDSVRLFEDIPDRHRSSEKAVDMADMVFRQYATSIAFDHATGKVVVSHLADTADEGSYDLAITYINGLVDRLLAPQEAGDKADVITKSEDFASSVDMDDAAFCAIVEQAKDHIRAGDVFQVVLSRTFEAPLQADPFDVYRAMRLVSPSPFMFYIDLDDAVIVGASPEKLVSLDEGVLQSCPLAGTRPRGQGVSDHDLEAELLNDEKERAEHMMLVDLARNDLGALSKAGSVRVNELMHVQKFSHVMHISSTVEGQISDDKDAFDALRLALPAGTLSGAPKIRAMEIIDALETSRRGVYGGTVCAIDHEGNLNSCIIIRTAVLKDGVARVRAGAGIVYDSDPMSEAMETRHKTRGVFEALRLAEGGLI